MKNRIRGKKITEQTILVFAKIFKKEKEVNIFVGLRKQHNYKCT